MEQIFSLVFWGPFLLLIITGISEGGCPDGYIRHDNSCYEEYNIAASWAESQMYCETFGANLVKVEDLSEHSFIKGLLGRMSPTAFRPGKFWIGGTSLLTNGTWLWVPGTEQMSVTLWAPGEPDANSEKRCMAIDFSHAFLWFSATCENKYNFLCEFILNSR